MPVSGARIYTIDSKFALSKLVEEYEIISTFGATDIISILLDWERIALNFDAVHITEDGYHANRWSEKFGEYDLYSFDCECTLWFRWMFEGVEECSNIWMNTILKESEVTE